MEVGQVAKTVYGSGIITKVNGKSIIVNVNGSAHKITVKQYQIMNGGM